MRKLHLGCGYNKLSGFINVDMDEKCKPDMVMNLDEYWNFPDGSIDHIKAHFVLEHVEYKHFFREAYRVLKKGGTMDICVPCGLDFTATQDPTHIKFYMPNSIQHLSNYVHAHYNSNNYNEWNFKHLSTKHLYRSYSNRLLHYFFRGFGVIDYIADKFGYDSEEKIMNLDNIAYLFVWGVQWKTKKE